MNASVPTVVRCTPSHSSATPSPEETAKVPPKTVLILGMSGSSVHAMFRGYGYTTVSALSDADVVCWTGGADVDPALYGEKPIRTTRFHRPRDDDEQEVYKKARAMGKMCVGICRGGQFLNVMNGGSLWQDVDNHTGSHFIETSAGEVLFASSTHHQMMRPTKRGKLLAWGKVATILHNEEHSDGHPAFGKDTEVVWYEDTKSLCFQPHPELPRHKECTDYFFTLITELYNG